MSDIFEKDIDSDIENIADLEDSNYQYNNYKDDDEDYVYPENLYKLRLDYSKEGIYATAGKNLNPKFGDKVVIPTRYGRDVATVLGKSKQPIGIKPDDVVQIDRIVSEQDEAHLQSLRERESQAESIFKEKVAFHKLDMKLICVHFLLDEQKALFFFSSDNRVDFRELVKDLVAVFKLRIELRQIGVRDESRITGGLGVCGRPYCCNSISDKLRPVSIKMAKEQNLSLNSMKISGQCGRLLCCLSYEYDWYIDARKKLPPEGIRLYYDGTNFRVTEVNPITSMIKMMGEDGRLIEINAQRFKKDNGRWKIVD
ncbi:MAG: hypothetical protein K6F69_10400 [Treponema sp.]|nr:hypothetical protein [Treponema sp.]